MLTLDQLRKDTQFAKERLAHKNFKDIHFVDEIIVLDDKRKLVKSYLDDFLSQRNSLSKEIGGLMKDGKKEEAEQLKLKIADKLIFSKWREALGGNVKGIITGAAQCPEKMARVFSAAGIPVREG